MFSNIENQPKRMLKAAFAEIIEEQTSNSARFPTMRYPEVFIAISLEALIEI
jgi:hypothetical protein